MSKPSLDALRAAADWWANQLAAPKFDNLGSTRGQNAEETRLNSLSSLLADVNASNNPVDFDQLSAFKDALVEAVTGAEWFDGCLYADYGPDRLLSEAASKSGIDQSRFPWKTGTWFNGDTVTAACGYGAHRVVIFPKEVPNA